MSEGSPPPKKKRGVVDIVFLMDATGSMEPCIDALKDNVTTFVESMCESSQMNPVKDWRAKVVGFRDFLEDDEPLVDNPFVKDPTAVRSQLDNLEAMGGEMSRNRCSMRSTTSPTWANPTRAPRNRIPTSGDTEATRLAS